MAMLSTSYIFQIITVALLGLATLSSASSPIAPNNNGGILLRVRMADGSMERLQVPPGAEDTLSLQAALSGLISEDDEANLTIQIGASKIQDSSQTISKLGLKRGTLISLAKKSTGKKKTSSKEESYFSSSKGSASDRWNPFPDIAKNYERAVRNTKTRRSSQSGMSYGDLANLQSALHMVEPQPEGPITRVYMCSNSAQRFQANCYKKTKNEFECRAALLFGTVQRERADLKQKSRTSLSSQAEGSEYCDVAKVHVLWEPPIQHSTKKLYDAKAFPTDFKTDAELQRVIRVADMLGLKPVGWIFAYNDNRHKKEESLPVYGADAQTGSLLQMANMKMMGRIDGSRFATLSMDATSGATEAFQLSDVCVQMVAEDLWDIPTDAKEGAQRFVSTKHAVLVDGKETKELDSVLCLVNTAMLSHAGSFAGPTTNSIKKSGGVTNKVKKAIISALDANDDGKLLQVLCDMNLLLTLDKSLSSADMEKLCTLVRKWARGQKRGTELDDKLKLLLRSMLDH